MGVLESIAAHKLRREHISLEKRKDLKRAYTKRSAHLQLKSFKERDTHSDANINYHSPHSRDSIKLAPVSCGSMDTNIYIKLMCNLHKCSYLESNTCISTANINTFKTFINTSKCDHFTFTPNTSTLQLWLIYQYSNTCMKTVVTR